MARADHARAGLIVRCAIYTRKSSDEGLEQEFNSLDAQREACGAYIVSQRHAGWIALSDMYDDGGLSGGTLERPALKRLLEDIQAGKVQIVVVYKVDRLTRSLSDFAQDRRRLRCAQCVLCVGDAAEERLSDSLLLVNSARRSRAACQNINDLGRSLPRQIGSKIVYTWLM